MYKKLLFIKSPIAKACCLAMGISTCSIAFTAENDKAETDESVIVVTGIRSSLNAAMQEKRNAESIQDSISAEDLGKFPDQNVAESLQRITGVSISRENGEGSKLTVRGFGPEFNLVQYNGRTLATTGRGRSFDFQLLPSELITGAKVVKAPTAQTPAGAIGGYVNVSSYSPLNKPGLQIAGSAKVKYNDLSENTDPQASFIVSNTFMDNNLGLAIGLTHNQGSNRIDQVLTNRWSTVNASQISGTITDMQGNDLNDPDGAYWYPGRYRFGMIEEDRERTGIAAVLEFAQGENITHTLDYLYSDFQRNEFRQGMQMPLQHENPGAFNNVVVSDNMTAVQGTKLPHTYRGNIRGNAYDGQFGNSGGESNTDAIGYHFEAFFNKWAVNFDASHSTAEDFENEFNFVPHFVAPFDENGDQAEYITYDLRGPGQIGTFDSNIDIGDPASARAHFNRLMQNQRSDEVTQFNLDLNYEADVGVLRSIDFGYSTSKRNKVDDAFRNLSGCGRGGPQVAEVPDAIAICNMRMDLDDSLFSINNSNYMSQESGNFPRDFVIVPDPDAYIAAIGVLQNNPDWADLRPRDGASVATDENKDQAYIKFNLDGDINNVLWRANVGVRHVSIENFSRGESKDRLSIEVDTDPANTAILINNIYSDTYVVERTYDYSRTLPSANVHFDFDNGFVLNLAASKVIAQPSILDIGVDTSIAEQQQAQNYKRSGGNPYLNPYESTQTDISLEYYQDNNNAYSINFFKKDIKSFIDRRTVIDTAPDIIVDGQRVDITVDVPGFGNLEEAVTGPINRAGGEITGIEFAALHYFDYLPEMFDGLGLQFNYTILDSNDNEAIPIGIDGISEPGSGLEGFSETSYNLIAFYEKYGWQARVAYNWRDNFLLSRNGRAQDAIPLYSEEYGQLDFSVSYDITENLKIRFAGTNVTDEKLFEYFDIPERLARLQYTGARYNLGIRFKF